MAGDDRRRRELLKTVPVAAVAGGVSFSVTATRQRNRPKPAESPETRDHQTVAEWTQQAKVTPGDGDSGDVFGESVAVSGDGTTAVVGAEDDEDPNGGDAGSAYVFSGSGDEWTRQEKLTADDGDNNDNFGQSVAVSGDGTAAVVGANGDQDPNGNGAGSAYVFNDTSTDTQTDDSSTDVSDGDEGETTTVSTGDSDAEASDGDGETPTVSSESSDAETSDDGGETPTVSTGGSDAEASDGDDDTTGTSTGFGPGFGVGSALAALGIGAYYRSWTTDDEE